VIKPTIGELLSGVATGLRERVLPEIPAGTTRRQIQAAIGVISRVALIWDKTAEYIVADNHDIEETLHRMLPLMERVAATERNDRLRTLCTTSSQVLGRSAQFSQTLTSVEVLGVRNLELQERLADLQEALHEHSASFVSDERRELSSMLYPLFRRMLTRELEITRPTRRP
jgi:hypothetical protein